MVSGHETADETNRAVASPFSKTPMLCWGICCCLFGVVGLIFTSVAKAAGEEFVRKHNQWAPNITMCETHPPRMTDPPFLAKYFLKQKPKPKCLKNDGYLLTPANYSDSVNFQCASAKLVEDLAHYNAQAGWKYVELPPRRGKHGQDHVKKIAAWWLPASDPKAPRIVLQHGNNVNANTQSVTVVAYLLRSMGFACLVPNLRDHGLSDASSHNSIGWGYDYHLDVLGAWDYAVHDPDKKLGGAMSKDRVGLMGFSLGAFVSSIAFGLEPEVPGVWLDSPVFEPREILDSYLDTSRLGFLSDPAWYFARKAAGVDLTLQTPAKALSSLASLPPPPPPPAKALSSLPHAKLKRPVAILHNMLDTMVPTSQSEELEAFLKTMPDRYEVKEYYRPTSSCSSSSHCTLMLSNPDVYRQKMCDFWTNVFGLPGDFCGIGALTKYDQETLKWSRRFSGKDDLKKESVTQVGKLRKQRRTIQSPSSLSLEELLPVVSQAPDAGNPPASWPTTDEELLARYR